MLCIENSRTLQYAKGLSTDLAVLDSIIKVGGDL